MQKVPDWQYQWDNCIDSDVYKETEEKLELENDYVVEYALSAVPTARKKYIGSCGYGRECDAICDIEIEENGIVKEIYMDIGEVRLESNKVDGNWDISKLFTLDKPLLVGIMSWSVDYIVICTNNNDKNNIKIKWKSIRYGNKKRHFLNTCEQRIKYPNCLIWYKDGMTSTVPLDCDDWKLSKHALDNASDAINFGP